MYSCANLFQFLVFLLPHVYLILVFYVAGKLSSNFAVRGTYFVQVSKVTNRKKHTNMVRHKKLRRFLRALELTSQR